MMLQPDSALYVVPANGGEARRLRGNTAGMNSWHSWSPNSRWLVFASKAFSPYTQLFLTHIDDLGNSSPPVLLSQFSSPDRAANIPEFVNAPPGALVKIEAQIALDLVCVREGNELIKTGDYDGAIGKYRAALAHNPKNVAARQRLGVLLFYTKGQPAEGMKHLAAAFALAPANLYCQYDWGMALLHQGQVAEAAPCLAEALRLMSDHTNATSDYNPFDTLHKLGLMLLPRHRRNRLMNPEPELEYALGLALFLKGDYEPSVAHLRRAATGSQSARFPEFPYQLALALVLQGKVDEAVPFYLAGRQQKPELDTALVLADLIGAGCANEDLFQQRIALARKELQTRIQAGRSAASSRAPK